MATRELNDCDTAPAVLQILTEQRSIEAHATVTQLQAAVAWAAMHSVDTIDHAAALPGTQGEVVIAGPGAPLVAEFCVAEFAAAMGMSTDAGSSYLGDAVELAHRLPLIYARVRALDLPVWKARRIAQATTSLPFDGAAFVDAHLHQVAHKVSLAQLDRTTEEARVRFDPVEAETRRLAAAEARHFDIEDHQVSFDGHVDVHGTLDLADALELEDAIAKRAEDLGRLGSTASLDVRRSMALGDLARKQLALDLAAYDEATADPKAKKPRQVVLHVHIADAAIARIDNIRSLISVEQVKTWCTNSDTHVVIRPVIDLAEHIHVDAYEVPDRLKHHQALVQHSCVFPWCRRPAAKTDCDHVEPAARGGPTCDCNTAPLCRRHHRLKTHDRWSYDKTDPTTFIWRSPNGLVIHRDHHGTTQLQQ